MEGDHLRVEIVIQPFRRQCVSGITLQCKRLALRRGRGHETGTSEPLAKLGQLDRVGADAGAKRPELATSKGEG